MKRRPLGRLGVALALLAGLVVMLVVWDWSNTYRYAVNVQVQTPQGIVTGRSVRSSHQSPFFPLGKLFDGWSQTGEAVIVELPHGQTLFLLLTDSGTMVKQDASGFGWWNEVEIWPNMGVAPFVSKSSPYYEDYRMNYQLPTLVRFRDLKDPTSVEKVEPANLAASFGQGYTLKRIWVTRTIAPVTTGIEKRLVWLPNVYHMGIRADFQPTGIPVGNFQGLFSSESFK